MCSPFLMIRIAGYWKTILIAAVILYFSLLRDPSYSLPPVHYGDKWAHLLAYAILGAIAFWDANTANKMGWSILLIAFVCPLLYGGAIEIVQEYFFYPRTGSWGDWLADCIGVAMGYGIIAAYLKIKKSKQ